MAKRLYADAFTDSTGKRWTVVVGSVDDGELERSEGLRSEYHASLRLEKLWKKHGGDDAPDG